jgi:cytochrome c553
LRLAVAVLAIVVVIAGGIYGISEWKMRRRYEAPLVPLKIHGPVDPVEGERMARIVGCWNGCHGPTGQGGHWSIDGLVANTAPTLSEVLPQYTDAELVRLVRYGVKRDGRSAIGMTSYTFWALGDQDLANIVAHLRRQPAVTPMARQAEIGWTARLALVRGVWKVSAEQVDRSRPRWGDQPQPTPYERGRYLASVTCSECHGLDYNGNPQERAPSLAILVMYSPAQFTRLIRTVTPANGRKLDDAMSWVADAPFTDQEIAGLYQFLRKHHGLEDR